ncbi:MAG: ankyrin repeat domain-containing protein [Bacteroidetes bacterium]|nr:ankyrin repeat domain-containing protein [Bacteroidota bacterium]
MKIAYIKFGFFLILLFWLQIMKANTADEKELIKAIKNGDDKYVFTVLKEKPDYDCEFSDGKSGLYYAIKYDQTVIAKLFLNKGADPNHVSGKYPLLLWAIKYDRNRIARLLIEFGANVNYRDRNLNTPLIFAVRYNNMPMCKLLIDRGADPTLENSSGNRATYYTSYWGNLDAKKYIADMEAKVFGSKTIPSLHDGPYIYKVKEDELNMVYFERVQSENSTRIIEKTIDFSNKDTIIKGFGRDKNTYHFQKKYSPVPYKISTDGEIFAVGDIHGNYKALINLLINNKVIDSDLKWNFGKGQLVFLGDLIDRGSMVTETLWFLHELSFEAAEAGGNLFVLLGNHETMALTGDHRYINEKYNYFTSYIVTNYFQLYAKETVLGRWLRNQNVILQINDNLFMHAGISPQFEIKKYSFTEINLALQNYLNSGKEIVDGSLEHDILSAYGPLWYRGYGYSENTAPRVPQQFVDVFLGSKGLNRMILGHNELPGISISYEGKVVSIDVRIDESGKSAQGLLISGKELYRCYSDGRKELLAK